MGLIIGVVAEEPIVHSGAYNIALELDALCNESVRGSRIEDRGFAGKEFPDRNTSIQPSPTSSVRTRIPALRPRSNRSGLGRGGRAAEAEAGGICNRP